MNTPKLLTPEIRTNSVNGTRKGRTRGRDDEIDSVNFTAVAAVAEGRLRHSNRLHAEIDLVVESKGRKITVKDRRDQPSAGRRSPISISMAVHENRETNVESAKSPDQRQNTILKPQKSENRQRISLQSRQVKGVPATAIEPRPPVEPQPNNNPRIDRAKIGPQLEMSRLVSQPTADPIVSDLKRSRGIEDVGRLHIHKIRMTRLRTIRTQIRRPSGERTDSTSEGRLHRHAKSTGSVAEKLEQILVNRTRIDKPHSSNNFSTANDQGAESHDLPTLLFHDKHANSRLTMQTVNHGDRGSIFKSFDTGHSLYVREIMSTIQSQIKNQSMTSGTKISIDLESNTLGPMELSLSENKRALHVVVQVGSDSVRDRLDNYKAEMIDQLRNLGYDDVSFEFSSRDNQFDRQPSENQRGNADENNVRLADESFFIDNDRFLMHDRVVTA